VNWHKQRAALDLIESARAQGVGVLADAYPYTAYSTGLSILMEDWALDGGRQAMLQRMRDGAQRERIRREVNANVLAEPGGYDLIVIASVESEKNRGVIGKDLLTIAKGWGVEPVDALLRLLDEEKRLGAVHRPRDERGQRRELLRHPLVHDRLRRPQHGAREARRRDAPAPALVRHVRRACCRTTRARNSCFRSRRRCAR
jgi:N-acyl-D-aspartate/D-glutamate deacylase